MSNKKTRFLRIITYLFIIIALLTIYTNTFAQPARITDINNTDPNITKTFIVKNIDPNIAAKSIKEIVKLEIFNISKETLIVPNHIDKLITVQTVNTDQMDLIEELIDNFDFQITNEGTINRKVIKLTNRIFDEAQRIISPVLSSVGHLSYNLSAQTLIVTDTTDNLTHIENLVTIIDSKNFDDPKVSIRFSDLGINKITQLLEQWTGKKIVLSGETENLRITVFTPERIKRSKAIALLYQAMRQQGCTIEETNDTINIKRPPKKPDPIQLIEPNETQENIPDKENENQKVFILKYEKPSVIGQLILPYLSPKGHFTADDSTNTLMIQDDTQTLKKIEQMIDVFDADPNSLPKGGLIRPLNPDDPNEQASFQNTLLPEIAAANPVENKGTNKKIQTNTIKNKSKLITYLDRIIKVLDSMTIKNNDPRVDVQFSNAGINQIIGTLIQWTGKAVLPSNDALNLKITLSSSKKIRQSKAIQLLYKAIEEQGYTIDNKNNIIYIKPATPDDPNEQASFQNTLLPESEAAASVDEMVSVNLSGMNIHEIAQVLQAWTGKAVIPSKESMDLTLTGFAPERMKRSEALKLLFDAILKQGFIIESTNNILYFRSLTQPSYYLLLGPEYSLNDIKNIETVVERQYKLKNYNCIEMGKLLIPLLGPSGQMTAESITNILMVHDTVKNLIKIEQMIDVFDADPNSLPKGGLIRPLNPNEPNEEIAEPNLSKYFQLNYIKPSEMKQILEPLISKNGHIDANDEKETLFIVDNAETLKRIENIIEEFDIEHSSIYEGGGIFVKPGGDPREIVNIINLILEAQRDPNLVIPAGRKKTTGRTGRTSKTQSDANSIGIQAIDSNEVPNLISHSGNWEINLTKEDLEKYKKDIEEFINKYEINDEQLEKEAQRKEYDAIYVKFINADLAAQKLNEILIEMQIDTKNRLIILPLATSKQILVFGENKDDRKLAQDLIHDIDFQETEDSYAFEKITLSHLDTKQFTNFVTNTIEEYENLRLSLYPIAPLKQVLVFGTKDYRDVIINFAQKVDLPELTK